MLQLRANLPESIGWQNVLGGLAPDNDQPMPLNLREMIQGHWRQIHERLGTEFNFDFWIRCQPRRDTYKACRAVIAAANQGYEDAMIEGIQKAYYLNAMNPSNPDTLIEIASGVGMEQGRFERDLDSEKTESDLRQQLALRDRMGVRSYPSLVLESSSGFVTIAHDYLDYRPTLIDIQSHVNR